MAKGRFFFICMLLQSLAFAQSDSTLWSPARSVFVPAQSDSLFLDSLPVLENSISINDSNGNPLPVLFTFYKKPFSHLKFPQKTAQILYVNYQIIDIPLNRIYRNKDTTLILPEIGSAPKNLYETQAAGGAFQPFAGLNSSGSISRSVSVGNNQDAVLNSSLNLQLSGDLGENTQIRASITDNSIPVQTGGYTQQLREFDRVYLELENPDFGLLRAGDYNMTSQQNQFLRFDKRISGAGIFTKINPSASSGQATGGNQIPLQLQGGIARGKFARNRFQGSEGNQGPYKLTGANGERFVIIISGSERVYIDGILMQRGEQNDYVMDYNAGEITFTALQPITKERRIVVEFQYTEQNFLRSVFYGESGFESENWQTSVSFYSEQDAKNQPLLEDLQDSEKELLSQVGDDLNAARVSAIRRSEFSNDLVLYELRDSLGFDSVLVFSLDSNAVLHQAAFTFLGENGGDYVLAQNNANGRVFRWVPPINGIPQGRYAPVKQLVAPNQLQILTARTAGKIAENHAINAELAMSKNDINLFSNLEEENDQGSAGKIQYILDKKLDNSVVNFGVNYEFNQDNFRTIERIRRVEFARDWNLPLNFNGGLQLGGISAGISDEKKSLILESDFLTLDGYDGFKNVVAGKLRDSSNIGFLQASFLTTKDSLGSTEFLRESGEFAHFVTPNFWAGIGSIGEWNQRQARGTDTLRRASYNFLEYRLFTGFGDSSANFTELSFLERWDDTARFGRFVNFSKATTYRVESNYKTKFNSTLNAKINLRNLKILEPEEKEIQRTVTTRFNYLQRFFSNSVVSTTFYEAGAGSEPRRTFSYLEVPAGTGTFTHTDYNGNGIKELDEFEVAPTPDLATFVRIFTPNNEFVRTSLQKFGQTLNLNAPSNWKSAEGIRSGLHRFSLLFNYLIDRKTLLDGTTNRLNPFEEIPDDTLIVALNRNFRSTVFFNRASTLLGADYTYRNTDNRNLLSFGIEQRKVIENTIKIRYQIFEPFLIKTGASFFDKNNLSGNFASRNFGIDQFRNENSISYQPGEKLVLTALYILDEQNSSAEENENTLFAQTAGVEMSYNAGQKLSLQLNLNYIKNDFEGAQNSPAGFEMLRELKPGNNGTWGLTLQRTFNKNILVSLNYNGRTSENSRPIHNGNVEVKAFF